MIEDDFSLAMERAGLQTKDRIIADGTLRRVHLHGDRPGTRNGWYTLYNDEIPAGVFGSWKTGEIIKWCSKPYRILTSQERRRHREKMEKMKIRQDERQKEVWKRTAQRAAEIWAYAPEAPQTHPYLEAKKVKNHGLRLYQKCLVVPLIQGNRNISGLQFIDPDGNKRFLTGSRKKGAFYIIGTPGRQIMICEGYATAASIHEATQVSTVVAFDAGNLLPVSRALRDSYPATEITICADNDADTDGNPGVTKAREAARAVDGKLAIPPVPGDFNDFLQGNE